MRGTVSLFWVGESVVPDYMYMCICVVHERIEGLSSTTNPKTHGENHPLLAQEHLIFFCAKGRVTEVLQHMLYMWQSRVEKKKHYSVCQYWRKMRLKFSNIRVLSACLEA